MHLSENSTLSLEEQVRTCKQAIQEQLNHIEQLDLRDEKLESVVAALAVEIGSIFTWLLRVEHTEEKEEVGKYIRSMDALQLLIHDTRALLQIADYTLQGIHDLPLLQRGEALKSASQNFSHCRMCLKAALCNTILSSAEETDRREAFIQLFGEEAWDIFEGYMHYCHSARRYARQLADWYDISVTSLFGGATPDQEKRKPRPQDAEMHLTEVDAVQLLLLKEKFCAVVPRRISQGLLEACETVLFEVSGKAGHTQNVALAEALDLCSHAIVLRTSCGDDLPLEYFGHITRLRRLLFDLCTTLPETSGSE